MGKPEQVKTVMSAYQEAKSGWGLWYEEALRDYSFYVGDQWDSGDAQKLTAEGRPVLSINHVKGNVDVISGQQRQNKSDIRVMPIEGSDEEYAELFTRVIKWIMHSRNGDFKVSEAFKDELICGIGWLHAYIDYKDDPLNGDVVIKKPSPFEILPDPHFVERDLSDCDYIIRHKKLSKDKLKALFPKFKKDIDRLAGNVQNDEYTQHAIIPNDQGEKVLVMEYWHRVIEKCTVLVNSQDLNDSFRWDGDEAEMEQYLEQNPNFQPIERELPKIKLTILVNEELVVYDGDSPNDIDDYPFIPFFGFYDSSMAQWEQKLMGIVRNLQDLQREKNKRRSQIMNSVNRQLHGGYMTERGSLEDPDALASGGVGKVIHVNPGKQFPQKIPQADFPTSIMQLEQMFGDDIKIVGANPDQMGMAQESRTPAVLAQLRQRQGLMRQQELFDSLSYAMRMLGRILIEYISDNFTNDKIKRIMGDDFKYTKQMKAVQAELEQVSTIELTPPPKQVQAGPEDMAINRMLPPEARAEYFRLKQEDVFEEEELDQEAMEAARQQTITELEIKLQAIRKAEMQFWVGFDKIRRSAKFDCAVDESIYSPTYRQSILAMLGQLAQYKVPVPPEMYLEFMELPKEMKERYTQKLQQMMMTQQQ